MAQKDKAESQAIEPEIYNIHQAMNRIMLEIGPISKSKKNTEQWYQFRGVDAAMDALNPLMAKYGVFPLITSIDTQLWEEVTSKSWKVWYHWIKRYTFAFMAKDWTSVTTTTEWEAIDYGDKTVTKCQSVAYREALYKTFVAPFEASAVDPAPKIDPQGSVDIEDQDHNIYDESKDQTKTKQTQVNQKKHQENKQNQPKKSDKATEWWVKKNKQLWEDYWVIKMGIHGHETDDHGNLRWTMENMWTYFEDLVALISGGIRDASQITKWQSAYLQSTIEKKLKSIIAEEEALRIQNQTGESESHQKVVHNQPTPAWKTQSETKASA